MAKTVTLRLDDDYRNASCHKDEAAFWYFLQVAVEKKGAGSLFPTRSLLNQMVLKALRIVAIGRKSSSALSGKGMKPN